jgi:hypothetical protein
MSCLNTVRGKLLCTEQVKENNLDAAGAFPDVEM